MFNIVLITLFSAGNEKLIYFLIMNKLSVLLLGSDILLEFGFRLMNEYFCNISNDKVGKSKHNKTLLRYRSQKKDSMFRPFYYKATIRSDVEN